MKSQPLLITILLLSLGWSTAQAQPHNRYTVLQNNYQNINPAAFNHLYQDYVNVPALVNVSLQHRAQSDDSGFPTNSQSLRVEYFEPDGKVMFGGSLHQERINIQQTQRITGNLSYLIDLDQRGSSQSDMKLLSLGFSGGYNLQSANLQGLPSLNPVHQFLPVTDVSYYTVSVGAFFMKKSRRGPDFYAGLSAHQNLGTAVTPASGQYFFVGGLLVPTLNHALVFEPTLTAQYAEYDGFITTEFDKTPLEAAAGLRLWYYPKSRFGLFGGTRLGTNDQALVEIGFSVYQQGYGGVRLPKRQLQRSRRSRKPPLRISYSRRFTTDGDDYPTPSQNIVAVLPISFKSKTSRRYRRNQRSNSTAPATGSSNPENSRM